MSAMPSPIQADFPSGSLPIRGPIEQSALNSGDLDDDPFAGVSEHQLRASRRRPSSFFGLLIVFCAGVAITVAWYSFGAAVREAIAGMSPQLAWVAPPASATGQPLVDPAAPAAPAIDQQLSAALPDIDAVRQNVDRIATSQDKIIKSIDQLSAGQEQLTKEIAKLQAVEQYILYKNSEPPAVATRSAPAAAPAVPRRPAAPLPLNPATAPAAQATPAPR
jgi:hypothetical protein